MNTKAFHATVHGLVQGVAFRYHTRATATRLHLSGWVRNLPKGAVEILAEGPPQQLKELATWLRKGPDFARVDRVDMEWQAPQGLSGSFEIRF